MARRLSEAHKKAISLALRRVKGATTGLDPYVPKPKKPKAPKKPTRASGGSGKKTAAKKTAGKKPAPATAAKKPATKKPAAKKAPAKRAPAKSAPAKATTPKATTPKKATAATNRPTPKPESPYQARKADAEFKANREARRDSTPFGSIRRSMAEAQLINGRNSDRDRDEDLADAIQRDSKLTYAEQEAKRNAGTVAQLNAAKRRKAALREKELADRQRASSTSGADQADYESNALQAMAKPGTKVTLNDGTTTELVGEPFFAEDVEGIVSALPGRFQNRDVSVHPDGTIHDNVSGDPIGRVNTGGETPQLSPGWVGRDEAPNMARAGDTVRGTGKSKFFKGEMKIVGDPYVEDDGHPYVQVAKRGSTDLVRADMEGNLLDGEGNIVATRVTEGGTKIKRTRSRGRGKSAKRSDAPDPRVSGFNIDGLW